MSVSASPTPGPSHRPHEILARSLYNHCQENFDSDHTITQTDLVNSNIIPNADLNLLVGAIQDLVDQRLFKVHTTKDGATVWKIVAHDAAAKYKGLEPDQAIVYQCIEASERAGIWSKTIKMRTNMHAKRVESALKHLINGQLIKQCKSVKFPSRVMYILYHLQPSEDVTGGAFFTDGLLDAALVNSISFVLEMKVSQLTWHQETVTNSAPRTSKGKEKASMTKAEAEAIRDAALQDPLESLPNAKRQKTSESHRSRSSNSPEITRSRMSKTRYVPYPAGYTGYPNLTDLTNYINGTGVVNNTFLPASAVNQVLNVLVYDDKLIKVRRKDPESNEEATTLYKTRHTPDVVNATYSGQVKDEGSDLTKIPCGRCPVFDLCEEGGPVSASNCEYWAAWIAEVQW